MATTVINSASTQEKLLRARGASAKLAQLSTEDKNALLRSIADAIEADAAAILLANREDMENSGLEGAMRDRLLLTPARIKEMAQGVRDVAELNDPIGEILAEWTRPNGLRIRKVRVPLGVVLDLKHCNDVCLCDHCRRYLYLREETPAVEPKAAVLQES